MPVETIYPGRKYTVRAWVDGEKCLVIDFLKDLSKHGDSDYARLMNLIVRTGDDGPTMNKNHLRTLGNGIFEIKGTNTARILFFYDKGSVIICSHGFSGKRGSEKRDVALQKEKASKIRDAYLVEKTKSND